MTTVIEKPRMGMTSDLPKADGVCKSCRAQIVWTTTSKGKRNPVDPTPVADGNLMLTQEYDNRNATSYSSLVIGKGDVVKDEAARFVSHFVTCPNAPQHRAQR